MDISLNIRHWIGKSESVAMGAFKAHAVHGFGAAGGDSAKSRQTGVAAGYAEGPASIRIAYNPTSIRKVDQWRANTVDVRQVAAACKYTLSKRSSLYAAYAKLHNTHFGTAKFDAGDKEADIGVRHAF